MVPGKCLSDSELQQLIESSTAPSQQDELEAHLELCVTCRNRLEELAGSIRVPSERGGETCQFASKALTQAIAKLRKVSPSSSVETRREQDSGRFSFLSPPTTPEQLGRLGKYDILSVIGEGGMGVVFAATDPTLHRDVAIKVPAHSLVATQEAHDRFMREARAIASVKHDNIVTVHAVEEHGETLFLVMELIDGQSLAQRMEQAGSLPWTEVARIGFETSAALVAAHARGLVHRDVKPGNILIEGGNGRVKVTDFGLAKSRVDTSLTGTGILAGTPEYMSPEQANDEEVTQPSDFFSLGAVLYSACAGTSPFRGRTAVTTLRRVCQEEVQPLHELDPSIPAWFSDLIQRLMSKSPSDRPAASELLQVLSDHQSQMRPALGHIYKAPEASPPTEKRRTPTLALSVLAIACLLVAIYAWPRGDKDGTESKIGFQLAGSTELFNSLADATTTMEEGGVIEVHGDGPFLVRSLDAGEKALTIRAAKGSAPVFMALTTSERSQKPFLTAKSDVHLQGIEVRWTIQNNAGFSSQDMGARCMIDVSGGDLKLDGCRLIAGRMNGCLSVSNGSLEMLNCHLVSPVGPCCRWIAGDDTTFTANNCVFQGRVGIMFDAFGGKTAAPMSFVLNNNSFATYRALHMLIDRPLRQAKFSSSRNAFDTQELLTLLLARRPLSVAKTSAGQARRLVMNYVDWTESKNGYRPETAFLTRSLGANREVLVSSLNDWQFMWKEGMSESMEIEFQKPEQADSQNPSHFADVRKPTSEEPIGADLTIIGPRTAQSED